MQIDNSNNIILLISLLSLGFFGGFSHCIGMCGPFIMSQISFKLQNFSLENYRGIKKIQNLMLIPYHAGRICTYSFIGFFVSLLNQTLRNFIYFNFASGLLLILAALFFLNKSFEGKFNINLLIVKKFNNNIFKKVKSLINPKFLDQLFKNPIGFNGFILGLILGFIPCGLLYGAFAVAATISNPIIASFAMFLFGLATTPALFSAGFGGYFIMKSAKKYFNLFARLVILINSATLFVLGISLLTK